MAVGYAYMLDLIPRERTAEFVGINAVSLSAPMIFGPIIAGKVIDSVGYRWVFPGAAACMIVGLIILQFVKARRSSEPIAG
jgi:MFS family permease